MHDTFANASTIGTCRMRKDLDFDVALSFAGEDRQYVDRVARGLRDHGVKVFYDMFEEAELWGKDLYTHLTEVYSRRARFTVIFISEAYGSKLWTNHERRGAQARAFQEAQEYILPARFDETEIPGVLHTVGYISLKDKHPDQLVSLIAKKIVSAGGSIPTELVRRDFGETSFVPAVKPTQLRVSVSDDEGGPIQDCTVTAQADNGTTIGGRTDAQGYCVLEINTRRKFCLLIAHSLFPAHLVDHVDPINDISIVLPRTENVGSVTVHSTGYIPGLTGRLNPIRDTIDRTYLYADNIAIDGGQPQPARFSVDVPIELEDAGGVIVFATIKHIEGDVALIQYSRKPSRST